MSQARPLQRTGAQSCWRPAYRSDGHPPVNETFAALGLLGWKPIIAALLLPPVPWLVMAVVAFRWVGRRRWLGGWLLALALAGGWLSHCQAVGQYLETLVSPASALSQAQVAELTRTLPGRKPVILVLGGGVQALAPEYGEPHLSDSAFQRLHYGLWLSRQLQAPVMVSGGLGNSQAAGPIEATVANRIAQRDYGVTLRWHEAASRDTRENARFSLLMLRKEGITDLLLVTHAGTWHVRCAPSRKRRRVSVLSPASCLRRWGWARVWARLSCAGCHLPKATGGCTGCFVNCWVGCRVPKSPPACHGWLLWPRWPRKTEPLRTF